MIIQKYIDGVEYTVSVVLWRDGIIQAVVPKEIICKRGITKLAITRRNQLIKQLCYKIQEKLHADGPFNLQLIIDKNTGIPYPIEINPRFSSTVYMRHKLGFTDVLWSLNDFFNEPIKLKEVSKGTTLVRYQDVMVLKDG